MKHLRRLACAVRGHDVRPTVVVWMERVDRKASVWQERAVDGPNVCRRCRWHDESFTVHGVPAGRVIDNLHVRFGARLADA